MKLHHSLLGACATVLFAAPAPGASDPAMRELVEVLRAEGAISQQAYEALKRTLDGPAEAPAAPVAQAAPPAQPAINTQGRLQVTSADGDFSFRLGGRLHFDANWYTDTNGVDFGSGSQLRRGRLSAEGRLWRDWEYKLDYDFTGSGRDGMQAAYLAYAGFEDTVLTVGHFKEPLGMEVLNSSNSLTFVERALPGVFAPSYSIGVQAQRRLANRVTATLGAFGEGINKSASEDETTADGLDEGWSLAGRLTWNPLLTEANIVHLGAAASFRKANDFGGTKVDPDFFRIRQRPESSVGSIRLVNTGSLTDVDDFLTWGLEAAWISGPLSLQGEYLAMDVSRDLNPDASFSGYYLMGSWVLTGESRRYDPVKGTFSNPRVKGVAGRGGIGAWELAARFSQIDLTDNLGGPGAVIGGEQRNMTLGVNWYPNDNLRFMLNWVKVLDVDRPGNALDGTEPSIVLIRSQVNW